MSSNKYGLLVDSQWCTGCHTCETACQMEHGLPIGQYGIKLAEVGPWQYDAAAGKKRWQYAYLPIPTDQCDACAARLAKGKEPTCVQHCQAQCLSFGSLDELKDRVADGAKQVLFALG